MGSHIWRARINIPGLLLHVSHVFMYFPTECTFNKIVNGQQLTVQFHVDDLKASHRDHKVLDEFLVELRKEFGKEDKLTENTGKIHDYLGMTIDYSIAGKVVFTMYDFLEDIIVEAPDDLKNNDLNIQGMTNYFTWMRTVNR